MSTGDRLASELADDTMTAMEELGDDRFYMEVAAVLGASSQTLEEAYLTEIRVRLAERTARQFLEDRVAKARKAKATSTQ